LVWIDGRFSHILPPGFVYYDAARREGRSDRRSSCALRATQYIPRSIEYRNNSRAGQSSVALYLTFGTK